MNQPDFKTADLCDEFSDQLQIAEPIFKNYGAKTKFGGEIYILKLFEDYGLTKETVNQNGDGKVLVIDGGGSPRCALFGDLLCTAAINNGWKGVLVNGYIRDIGDINEMRLSVKALGTCPVKPPLEGAGRSNVPVRFAGVNFHPGHHVYSDEDGIIVSETALI